MPTMPKIFPIEAEIALKTIEMIVIIVVINRAHSLPFNMPQATIKLAHPTTLNTQPTKAISQPNNTNIVAFEVSILLALLRDETDSLIPTEVSLNCNWDKWEIDIKPIPPNNNMKPPTTRSIAIILTPKGHFIFNPCESYVSKIKMF